MRANEPRVCVARASVNKRSFLTVSIINSHSLCFSHVIDSLVQGIFVVVFLTKFLTDGKVFFFLCPPTRWRSMTNETNLKEGKNSILAAVSANVGKLILEKEKKRNE